MKKLLAKIALRKAIGVYIGEQSIAISQVAATPLGVAEITQQRENYTDEQLPQVLDRLLKPLLGPRKRRRLPVALGMPALRVFFSTRPIRTTNRDASPQALLHEVLQSPSICIDDMVVEVIKAQPGKRKLASIASCRKKYLAGFLEALKGCGVRPFRAEPAPCALLRAAAQQQRAPRRSKTVLHIFLGDGQALAVVTAGSLSVLWRFFNLRPGGEAPALCSAVRSVQVLILHCGIDSPLDTVMLHGRADLRSKLEAEDFPRQVAARLVWCAGPKLDDSAVAFGLALGCLGQQPDEAFDLSRSLKPRACIWDVFPWGEVALQVSLLVCMGLFLLVRSRSLDEAYAAVQAENRQRAWLSSVREAQLEKEKKDLEQRVEAIRRFVASRIIWTSYTRDISARLPANATLNSFQGLCELEFFGQQKASVLKPKKSFVLRAAAPIAQDGSTPKEVDRFLVSLRGHPLLKRDFPLVELADIKWFQPNTGVQPNAIFTVVCLPKADKGAPKPPESKGEARAGQK